jgi:hypothetical protein
MLHASLVLLNQEMTWILYLRESGSIGNVSSAENDCTQVYKRYEPSLICIYLVFAIFLCSCNNVTHLTWLLHRQNARTVNNDLWADLHGQRVWNWWNSRHDDSSVRL